MRIESKKGENIGVPTGLGNKEVIVGSSQAVGVAVNYVAQP